MLSSRRRVLAAALALVSLLLVASAPASARDDSITSFDGTKIVLHFFPAAKKGADGRNATVLFGPGWSQPGATDPDQATATSTGAVGIGPLRQAGFNVLTWDPRGFGTSGGNATVDSPQFEGRDVQALIDYVAKQPEARLDKPGDPRVGMTGASYGGGIQLVTAGIEPRLDAIAPDIAWHSLETSLYKDATLKSGWGAILTSLGNALGRLDPHVDSAFQQGITDGALDADNLNFFRSRGPGDLVKKITIPTFLIQGTVDTLFTLDEATTNYGILRGNGVPVKMLWFCGGHGACLTNAGDTGRIERDTLAWLHRYLDGDTSVDTGPRFEFLDQDGKSYSADDYPLPASTPISADGSGVLPLTQAGGSGPATPSGATTDPVVALAAPVAAAKATNAVNVPIAAPKQTAMVVGAPKVDLTYTATATGQSQDGRIGAQLVDDATGKVLGNQITPIPVVLDGAQHTVSRPLEIVSASLKPGQTFTLQLVAASTAYNLQRAVGTITFGKVHVTLPTVDLAKAAAPPAAACTSKRTITLHVPRAYRGRVRSTDILVAGKRVATTKGSAKTISLAGRAGGPVTVKLVMHLKGGGTRTDTRRYTLCKAGTARG